MHSYYRWFLSLLVVTVALAGIALAGGPQDGKLLYRSNCKVCHDKASKNGTYTPMTLTQDQWRKFFTTKLSASHKTVVHPKEGKKLFDVLSPEQIKSIQRFCIDHAADSEQPATCG